MIVNCSDKYLVFGCFIWVGRKKQDGLRLPICVCLSSFWLSLFSSVDAIKCRLCWSGGLCFFFNSMFYSEQTDARVLWGQHLSLLMLLHYSPLFCFSVRTISFSITFLFPLTLPPHSAASLPFLKMFLSLFLPYIKKNWTTYWQL